MIRFLQSGIIGASIFVGIATIMLCVSFFLPEKSEESKSSDKKMMILWIAIGLFSWAIAYVVEPYIF